MAHVPESVAVIGGGRMGGGIAQVYATAGAEVIVVEADDAAAQRASEQFAATLERAVARGQINDGGPITSRVQFTHGVQQIPSNVRLVIEAIPEDVALKQEILGAAEAAVSEAAVLASNTSALPISELAISLAHPGRFLGMHFFNPVPASALVELVRGPATDPAVVTQAEEWVSAIDKTAVVVNDAPGFATSRLGVAIGLEAIRMAEDGVAEPAAIDTAMELGYRHPMGPLKLTDLVGLDVRLAVAQHLERELGPRFAPPQLLEDKVARGELGRKTGQGFYTWP